MSRPKLRLAAPEPVRSVPTTAAYEIGLSLGAISVRREDADKARRLACDAFNLGEIGESVRLHLEADQHLSEIAKHAERIGTMGGMK